MGPLQVIALLGPLVILGWLMVADRLDRWVDGEPRVMLAARAVPGAQPPVTAVDPRDDDTVATQPALDAAQAARRRVAAASEH